MSTDPTPDDAALLAHAELVADYYACGGPALDWTTYLLVWTPLQRSLAKLAYAQQVDGAHRHLAALLAQALGAPAERLADAIGGDRGADLADRAASRDAALAALDLVGEPPPAAVSARGLARNEVFG